MVGTRSTRGSTLVALKNVEKNSDGILDLNLFIVVLRNVYTRNEIARVSVTFHDRNGVASVLPLTNDA